ncbi:MAG TPA: hypothetical protein VLM40_18335, partial [Gemmata sp.]|nr:hypothetical protein [Gemmata sp.]
AFTATLEEFLLRRIDMGNPAMAKRKKSEKRRKKYEQRLGPGAYMPKEERIAFNAEVEKAAAAAMKEKKEREAAKEKAKAAKKAQKDKPAPAAAPEKK